MFRDSARGESDVVDLQQLVSQAFLDTSFPLPIDRPFTTEQARSAGVSRSALTRLCAEGLLRRPIKSVYIAAQNGDSVSLRAQALALVVPSDCVICDRHAGWLHGAAMILAPNEHLHLQPISVFRPSGRGRLRNELSSSGERNLSAGDVVELHGLAVTSPIRTAWDLGRVRYREPALSGMDAMLRLRAFEADEFLAGIERFRTMRWVRNLRALAPVADGRSESPGESVLRLRWLDCGLPAVVPQVEVWRDGVLIARLDLACEELRFAAEYDGAEWHSSPDQQAHDRVRRQAVEREDWLVKAFTSANVFGRGRDIEELLHAAAREARARQANRVYL